MNEQLCRDIINAKLNRPVERYQIVRYEGKDVIIYDRLRRVQLIVPLRKLDVCDEFVEEERHFLRDLRGWVLRVLRRAIDGRIVAVALQSSDTIYLLDEIACDEDLRSFLSDPLNWLRLRAPDLYRKLFVGVVMMDADEFFRHFTPQ